MDPALHKIMILSGNILDALSLEEVLRGAGYEHIITQTSANGAFARVDYESPSVLVIDPTLQNLNITRLIKSIYASPRLSELAIVLFAQEDAEILEAWAIEHDTDGYYSKDVGFHSFANFITQLCNSIHANITEYGEEATVDE